MGYDAGMIETYPLQRREMLEAYRAQRSGAKARGIAFRFGFEDWCAWWLEDDRWQRRGKRGGLVMARYEDRGAYEPGNVYCCTSGENCRHGAGYRRPWKRPRQFEGRLGDALAWAAADRRDVAHKAKYPLCAY